LRWKLYDRDGIDGARFGAVIRLVYYTGIGLAEYRGTKMGIRASVRQSIVWSSGAGEHIWVACSPRWWNKTARSRGGLQKEYH
jgi:hypothetical protein